MERVLRAGNPHTGWSGQFYLSLSEVKVQSIPTIFNNLSIQPDFSCSRLIIFCGSASTHIGNNMPVKTIFPCCPHNRERRTKKMARNDVFAAREESSPQNTFCADTGVWPGMSGLGDIAAGRGYGLIATGRLPAVLPRQNHMTGNVIESGAARLPDKRITFTGHLLQTSGHLATGAPGPPDVESAIRPPNNLYITEILCNRDTCI